MLYLIEKSCTLATSAWTIFAGVVFASRLENLFHISSEAQCIRVGNVNHITGTTLYVLLVQLEPSQGTQINMTLYSDSKPGNSYPGSLWLSSDRSFVQWECKMTREEAHNGTTPVDLSGTISVMDVSR